MGTIRIRAKSNVWQLVVGDEADIDENYPELTDALTLGFVVRLDAEGNEINPVEPRRAGGSCCGNRRRV